MIREYSNLLITASILFVLLMSACGPTCPNGHCDAGCVPLEAKDGTIYCAGTR